MDVAVINSDENMEMTPLGIPVSLRSFLMFLGLQSIVKQTTKEYGLTIRVTTLGSSPV